MIVVLITAPKEEGKKIAKTLLEQKLCACVNIVEEVNSFFLWQNKIDSEKECLLVAKTDNSLFAKLEKEVRNIHPYDVPEIISFKLNNVSKPYQNWLNQELGVSTSD